MYSLGNIRRVGWVHLATGMAALVIGVAVQVAVGLQLEKVLTNNLIYYCLFALGWLIFNQIVMGGTYKKLVSESGRAKLLRLERLPQGDPTGPLNQPYLRFELLLMLGWLLLVVILQLLFGANLTLPLGGFVGGWLVGSGLGRLRFAGKLALEETEQQRRFFFSDSGLTPRTEIAFYSERPDEAQPAGFPAAAAGSQTGAAAPPPGVKRRAEAATKDRPAGRK